ncbi:MAG: hypothetical protein QF535_10215 [Anaerolineales bacterium]|nr:hypothetical protein [Anaerolineales bacterium]
MAASAVFTPTVVGYSTGATTGDAYDEGDNKKDFFSNYIGVNNLVRFKFTVTDPLLTRLRATGFRVVPYSTSDFVLMNHAWKLNDVSKTPTKTSPCASCTAG